MTKQQNWFLNAEMRVTRLIRLCLASLLFAATGLIFINVVLRYVFNSGITWAEEVSDYGLVWITFLGGGLAAFRAGHISIDILQIALPSWARRINIAIVNVISCVAALIVGYLGWQVAVAVRAFGQVGTASGIPIYLVYAAIPTGCVLMVVGFWTEARRAIRSNIDQPNKEISFDS